jgi:hypothetical protein
MGTTPLPDGLRVVAITPHCRHKASEQERQIITSSVTGARIGDGGKGGVQTEEASEARASADVGEASTKAVSQEVP